MNAKNNRKILRLRIYADNVINKDGKDGIWNLRSELCCLMIELRYLELELTDDERIKVFSFGIAL